MNYRAIEYSGSSWYNREMSRINNLELTLGKKVAGRYQVDLLKRIARRLDEFSASCGECERLKQEFSEMVKDTDESQQAGDREAKKRFRSSLKEIQGHLTKDHKLITKGYYVGIGLSMGTSIGAALYASMDNPVFTGAGVLAGIAVGIFLEIKARKENRIL